MQLTVRMLQWFCMFGMCLFAASIHAQGTPHIVQFSGKVMTVQDGNKLPLPYANVGIVRNRRATYTNELGFFSMPALEGDTIVVQYLGFKTIHHALPPQIKDGSFYIEFVLHRDTIELQRAIVYPIPSKEHFKQEFLAMNVSDPLRDIAEKNLAPDVLAWIAPGVPSDPRSSVNLYFQQQAVIAIYDGQFKPQNIFNPMAWVSFIQALKRGDFKNKRKPPK